MRKPQWQWNEMQQVGTDYTDLHEVEAYDRRMGTLRDIESENIKILETLNLPAEAAVLEIGCGTGRFARMAAGRGYKVTAVDVSQVMLDYVAQKVIEEKLTEIEFQHAGFLTMDLQERSFDAVVTVAALHHLPDIWKKVAFDNIFRFLKPGGQLLLRDMVFAYAGNDYRKYYDGVIDAMPAPLKAGAIRHIAQEYSTFDWIIEGLLRGAGFDLLSSTRELDFFFVYHCRKPL